MENVKKLNIHIYSKDNFIKELLQQRQYNYNIMQYASYIAPKLSFQQNIQNVILIDYTQNALNIDEFISKFYATCHIIIIVNELNTSSDFQNKHIELLKTPISYRELFLLIDNIPQSIYCISENFILNTTLRLLIKIKDSNITEI